MDLSLQSIIAFRSRFGLPVPDEPTEIPVQEIKDYISFMREELTELEDALLVPDDKARWGEMSDALCDQLVFFHHLTCKLGIGKAMHDLFAEVDNSNHTKGDGNVLFDSETGKMIKGIGYQKPDMHKFFRDTLTGSTECVSKIDFTEKARNIQNALISMFLDEKDQWTMRANFDSLITEIDMVGNNIWFRARKLQGKFNILNNSDEKLGHVIFDIPNCTDYTERDVIMNDNTLFVRPSNCL